MVLGGGGLVGRRGWSFSSTGGGRGVLEGGRRGLVGGVGRGRGRRRLLVVGAVCGGAAARSTDAYFSGATGRVLLPSDGIRTSTELQDACFHRVMGPFPELQDACFHGVTGHVRELQDACYYGVTGRVLLRSSRTSTPSELPYEGIFFQLDCWRMDSRRDEYRELERLRFYRVTGHVLSRGSRPLPFAE